MAIYRIFRERVFEPETVICMAKAYEGALVALQLSDRHDPLTEIVAKKIVEIAETGERDHARIRDRALEELRGNGAPRAPGKALCALYPVFRLNNTSDTVLAERGLQGLW
jgi:hypothetical protein